MVKISQRYLSGVVDCDRISTWVRSRISRLFSGAIFEHRSDMLITVLCMLCACGHTSCETSAHRKAWLHGAHTKP